MTSKVIYSKTNSWNSGLQAEIILSAEEALNGWTIEFDASYPISQIWNARIISHIGNHYVIANADWNAAVAKGGTVSFGFIAGLGDAPTGYLVNGQPLSTAPVPPPSPVLPSISVADIAVAEGNAGQGAATFTVRLSAPSTTAVSLAYATAPGSAAAGTDFEARSGTLIFAPGETTKTVTVVVKGDAAVEANETFSLVLSGAVGATLVGTGATATIVNDDATIVTPPAATVTDAAVTEDARGSVQAIFTVSLTRPADGPVSLRYATRDGTAIAGADYVAASGTIAFAAGETSKTIAVAVQDDQAVEGDEAFALVLSDAAGASIGRGTGTATIRDNDAPPPPTPPATGAVSYAVASDWGNGFTAEVQVTASASRLDGWTVAFDAGFSITNLWNAEIVSHVGTHYVIRNAAWNGAVAPSGTVSFGFQASTSSGHDVSQLVLAAAGGTGGALPALSIADATVTEGNAGSASESFTVSLSHAATTAVTVGFATASGSAVAGADFVAATGTITFNPGEVSKVLTVAVLGDTVQEATETYGITLSAASGATIADGAAVGTILDNDAVTGQPPPATAGFFHTEGNQIVDASGHPVEIAGVNWFGFETATAAPHGLFARSYTAMMDQMKALGFNTIRLPFSDQLLRSLRQHAERHRLHPEPRPAWPQRTCRSWTRSSPTPARSG